MAKKGSNRSRGINPIFRSLRALRLAQHKLREVISTIRKAEIATAFEEGLAMT